VTPACPCRPARKDEYGFIIDAYLTSYKRSDYAGGLPNDVYWKAYREAIERLLVKKSTRVLVAYNPEDPEKGSDLFGFLIHTVGEGVPVVHYVYTKHVMRQQGVAKAAGIDPTCAWKYTHKTARGALALRGYNGKFEPSIVRDTRGDWKDAA
jgi:hypothetical protein